MDILSKTHLFIKKLEREYSFILPHDAPLGEIHDVLHELKQFVGNKMVEILTKEKEEKTPNPPSLEAQE